MLIVVGVCDVLKALPPRGPPKVNHPQTSTPPSSLRISASHAPYSLRPTARPPHSCPYPTHPPVPPSPSSVSPRPSKRRERVFHTRSVRRSALKRSERSDSNRQTDSRLPGRCTSSRYMYPLDIHLQKSPRSQPRHNPASGFGMFASAPALELSSPGCECAIHISYDRSRTRLWTVLSFVTYASVTINIPPQEG